MTAYRLKVQRHTEAMKDYGLPRASYYAQMSEGLIPQSFKIGEWASGQLDHETQAVIAARAAGKTPEEIKELVALLAEQRKNLVGVLS